MPLARIRSLRLQTARKSSGKAVRILRENALFRYPGSKGFLFSMSHQSNVSREAAKTSCEAFSCLLWPPRRLFCVRKRKMRPGSVLFRRWRTESSYDRRKTFARKSLPRLPHTQSFTCTSVHVKWKHVTSNLLHYLHVLRPLFPRVTERPILKHLHLSLTCQNMSYKDNSFLPHDFSICFREMQFSRLARNEISPPNLFMEPSSTRMKWVWLLSRHAPCDSILDVIW